VFAFTLAPEVDSSSVFDVSKKLKEMGPGLPSLVCGDGIASWDDADVGESAEFSACHEDTESNYGAD